VIARVEGLLIEKTPETVVLDVNGVGYEVRVPLSTFLELPDSGKTVSLRIHTYVREDAIHLYGFRTDPERTGFRLLLGISGVGPRLALAVLSGIPVPRLVAAIRSGDVAALRGIPGVGLKTAQRMLVELRDKIDRLDVAPEAEPGENVEGSTISALLNLGYPRSQAEKVVRTALERLGEKPTIEELVREALRAAAR
jgi:Holliday junction DNA helicase RuvA